MGSKVIQEDDCPKEEFQDEPIKHILQIVPEMISSFFFIFLEVKNILLNFFIMITQIGQNFKVRHRVNEIDAPLMFIKLFSPNPAWNSGNM